MSPNGEQWCNDNWEELFQRLLEYRFENGHWRVPNPCDNDPELGLWVAKLHMEYHAVQRRRGFRDSTTLTLERERKLTQVGFQWINPTQVVKKMECSKTPQKNSKYGQGTNGFASNAKPACDLSTKKEVFDLSTNQKIFHRNLANKLELDAAARMGLSKATSTSWLESSENPRKRKVSPLIQPVKSRSSQECYTSHIGTLADVAFAITALGNEPKKSKTTNIVPSTPISPAKAAHTKEEQRINHNSRKNSLAQINSTKAEKDLKQHGKLQTTNFWTLEQEKQLHHYKCPRELTEHDVIVGGGKKGHNHVGNVRFRHLIAGMIEEYWRGTRAEKSIILKAMVADVRSKGTFVRKDPKDGSYEVVGDFAAREMTSQAFRNFKGEGYSSSLKTKKDRRAKEVMSKKLQISNHITYAIARSGGPALNFQP